MTKSINIGESGQHHLESPGATTSGFTLESGSEPYVCSGSLRNPRGSSSLQSIPFLSGGFFIMWLRTKPITPVRQCF